jgi:hypothetical protein
MQHLIASYLFTNKSCPLPGLGTLCLQTGNAESDFLNSVIKAPLPVISFNNKDNDASNLVDYIATKTNSAALDVIQKLGHFCNSIKAAAIAGQPALLDGVGSFFADASGNIKFTSVQLPAAFFTAVHAERVIHPQAEHPMLVGDKETTNTVMTEYYSEAPVKKNRWWIWGIVIAVIALLAILVYLNANNASPLFGNLMPVM